MTQTRKAWFALFFTAALCLFSPSTRAEEGFAPCGAFQRILFLASDDTRLHQEVFQGLRSRLPREIPLVYTALGGPDAAPWVQSTDCPCCLVVTSGTRALQHAVKRVSRARILSITIPREAYDRIMAQVPDFRRYAAVYMDIPLGQRIAITRRHLAGMERFAIVQSAQGPFAAQGADDPAEVVRLVSHGEADLVDTFTRAARQADAILTLPDRRVYNPRTIVSIMMTTYRQGIPLIGHSEALLRAGALLSIHAPPQRLGTEAASLILRPPADWGGVRRHTREQVVAVNEQVARALRIHVERP
ncbi:hypothetical protein [Ectothiorhodospira mobilis]|uniref:hypothetical protein n=1 Tax=Ectothiorhodospira mobilis TaxID=195064 RepID=UPI001908F09C|nr:hypothetical protein [Ectothiorhodospira mobilis]MBK1692300.1 hypothetical protein [Ectothiorhodospira mobilis]